MPVSIRITLSEKRSTTSQYENATFGADIEATGLELHTPEAIRDKAHELFVLARSAIQRQLLEPLPSEHARGGPHHGSQGNGYSEGNGSGHSKAAAKRNGTRRTFGRPHPEPTPKQKQFLRQIAKDRHLDAQTIGEICERIVGKPVRACNREELSRLIDGLLEDAA